MQYRSHQFPINKSNLSQAIVAARVHEIDVQSIYTGSVNCIVTVMGEKSRVECFAEEFCMFAVHRPYLGINFKE